ncbi:hypothetical protein AB0M02_39380 [Actinoplanes sp. NPDC051861]|uniref:hypothetical protein n=1 Tax=Actinoplanes sp. NPDC051861 TaxID=3155170 RepID=UPI003429BD26
MFTASPAAAVDINCVSFKSSIYYETKCKSWDPTAMYNAWIECTDGEYLSGQLRTVGFANSYGGVSGISCLTPYRIVRAGTNRY